MWPFSNMSLAVATLIGNAKNIFLLSSLIVGVVSTFFIVQTANKKEELWDLEKYRSKERIVVLETEAVKLAAETAKANALVAEAHLEIARIKAPRIITTELRQVIQEIAKRCNDPLIPFGLSVAPTQEAKYLMAQIKEVLQNSGLLYVPWPPHDQDYYVSYPEKVAIGKNEREGLLFSYFEEDKARLEKCSAEIAAAFIQTGISAVSHSLEGPRPTGTGGRLLVIVGSKPL